MSKIGKAGMAWMARNWRLVIVIAWLAITLLAIGGMYHLWWTRERVLYVDKDVHEQRLEVFRRGGISQALLTGAEHINRTWPFHAQYRASGDANQLSYVKYLILPRIPSGGVDFAIRVNAGQMQIHPETPSTFNPIEIGPAPRGVLISLFLICGFAFLLGRSHIIRDFWFPELMGLAVFILAMLIMASRLFMQDASYAFWIITIVGVIGWLFSSTPRIRTIMAVIRKCGAGDFHLKEAIWLRLKNPSYLFFTVLSLIAIVIFIWSVLMSVIVVPDDWDAWAIWGAKAKVLALGKGPLTDVMYFPYPDYPLLWPAVWAFSGWCAGGWEEHWSRAWGPIFMALCAWEMGMVLSRVTGRRGLGLLICVSFLSIPMVPLLSTWSYAEAPLWLMISCCFAHLLLWKRDMWDRHLLIAGLFAAGAAYTKNEGLFFAVVCLIWLIMTTPKSFWKLIFYYATPLTILYLPWILWVRGILKLDSHAFEGFQGGMNSLQRALDRFPVALQAVGTMWIDIRQWNITLWVILAMSLYHLIRNKGHRLDLFVPVVLLLSYFVINVFHMEEIGLLMSSWNRLTVQTLPVFLMILGMHFLTDRAKGEEVILPK